MPTLYIPLYKPLFNPLAAPPPPSQTVIFSTVYYNPGTLAPTMADYRSGSYEDEPYDIYPSGHLLSSAKRPFRPRRKEPSCDTCRERKVKVYIFSMSQNSDCSAMQMGQKLVQNVKLVMFDVNLLKNTIKECHR